MKPVFILTPEAIKEALERLAASTITLPKGEYRWLPDDEPPTGAPAQEAAR